MAGSAGAPQKTRDMMGTDRSPKCERVVLALKIDSKPSEKSFLYRGRENFYCQFFSAFNPSSTE